MKNRILLVTTKPGAHSTTTGVEVADLKDLSTTLASLGATRLVRYWRDRTGDGHTEGAPFAPGDLAPTHLEWLLTGPKDAARALFYDTQP